jgi:hypothetical protein
MKPPPQAGPPSRHPITGTTPSRDDPGTPPCPICQHRFTPVGRQAYCSARCRKTAFRRRHQDPRPAIVIPAARPSREHAIYQCPACGQRQAGQQRCEDCGIFGRKTGTGGPCPHCDEPVLVTELLDQLDN